MFHVGQRVVCIKACPSGCGLGTETLPQVGTTYTVRDVDVCRFSGIVCLYLVEIVNPEALYFITQLGFHVRCEPAFSGSQFRPVKTTSIEIFRQMLAPKEVEPA